MQKAVRQLYLRSQNSNSICPQTFSSLLQSSLSSGDLCNLSALVKTFPTRSCALPLLERLKSSPSILSPSNLRQMLKLIRDYDPASRGVLDAWEQYMLTSMNIRLIACYLAELKQQELSVTVSQFCKELDLRLRTSDMSNATSSDMVLLLLEMKTSHVFFTTQAYESLIKPAKTKLFTTSDIVQLCHNVTFCKLPVTTLVEFLTGMKEQILVKVMGMSQKDMSLIMSAYSLNPMECSREVLERIISRLDLSAMSRIDMAFIVNALCRFPIAEDRKVFQAVEQCIMKDQNIPISRLSLTIHAFSKRGEGSPALFAVFERLFKQQRMEMPHNEVAQLIYSFLRSDFTRSEFKKELAKVVPELLTMKEIPMKIAEALRFWSQKQRTNSQ